MYTAGKNGGNKYPCAISVSFSDCHASSKRALAFCFLIAFAFLFSFWVLELFASLHVLLGHVEGILYIHT